MTTGFPKETGYTLDTLLNLVDSHADTASDTTVGSIIDIAAAGSGGNEDAAVEFKGDLVIDISALDVASNDELYTIRLIGGDDATHTTGVEELATIAVGPNETIVGDVDSDAGRYVVPFSNKRNTRVYRYVGLQIVVAGTTPTITWSAFIGKRKTG